MYVRKLLGRTLAELFTDAGQAALPGGKADTLQETPWITARREAWEEIGLPTSDSKLPPGYTVEHLAELPANLAMTELGVRPCVAWLKTPAPSERNPNPDATRDLLPRMDAKEVAALFTAPFHNFLRMHDEDPETARQVPGEWYKGSWHSWHESAWRMHSFSVPVNPTTVFLAKKPLSYVDPRAAKARAQQESKIKESESDEGASKKASPPKTRALQPPLPRSFYHIPDDALQQPRYRVFGMTARILVDAARVAYGEEPDFEHNSHFGDEDMILKLLSIGRLNAVKKEGEWLDRDTMKRANEVKL